MTALEALRGSVIAEARSWVNTPFRHQARLKGVGVDCANLIIAVGESVGVLEIAPDLWRPFADYGRLPNPSRMRAAMETFLVPIADREALPGDIAWLAWRDDLPMHLAILSVHLGRATIIHALEDIRKAAEHGYAAEWPARLDSWWRYPGIAALGALTPAQAGAAAMGA